jgi:hypothetical protein
LLSYVEDERSTGSTADRGILILTPAHPLERDGQPSPSSATPCAGVNSERMLVILAERCRDLGKEEQGDTFKRTGALNSPPSELRTKLETKHEMSGSMIPQCLEDLKTNWPRLAAKYTRSDSLEDILFNAEEKGGLFLARAGLSSYLYRLCTTCVNLSMLGVVSTPSQFLNIEKRHRQSGRSPPCPSSTGLKTPFSLSGQCAPCDFVMPAALSISSRPLPPPLMP